MRICFKEIHDAIMTIVSPLRWLRQRNMADESYQPATDNERWRLVI
jgi:hypothetical protein